MLKFALKNMLVKKVQIVLIVLSIIISASVAVLAFNISSQVSDGITKNAMWYSSIVGPSGSETQLAMNTMYFTDKPVGTIPFSVVSALSADSRVLEAVPFSMADNYNGSSVVGTTTAFLERDGEKIETKDGTLFDDQKTMQAVLGYNVAKSNGVKVGDQIYTSHSATSHETHDKAITIVGILEKTNSSMDNVVFTQYKTLWEMHEHTGEEHSGEEHEHSHSHTVCAVLLKTKNLSGAEQIISEYNGKTVTDDEGNTASLQAIAPMNAVREVLNDADDTKYIVFVLCAVILVMNIMIISIITLLNMYHSAKEISLMRLIGISMKRINLLYLIQNGIIGAFSVCLAFLSSRVMLVLMNDYVSSMGVVLNYMKVYPLELVILLAVFLISVVPTLVWTLVMSKKDSLAG